MATLIEAHSLPTLTLPDPRTCGTSRTSLAAARSLDAMCQRFGYFQLENHGIDGAAIRRAMRESAAFFKRSSSDKAGYTAGVETQFLGYRRLGAEKSLFHGGAEACEQYRIGCSHHRGAAPIDSAHFHEPFAESTALFASMVGLGDRLMALAALGQSDDADRFTPFFESPMHRLGLNYYAPGSSAQLGNSVNYAMSPHVDRAVFTIVIQDEPGLELRSPDGNWLSVPAGPDVLVGFIGDYFQRWTNGRYRALQHRVGEIRRDRISIQYKHKPSYAVVVQPLARFLAADGQQRYEPFDTGTQYERLLSALLS